MSTGTLVPEKGAATLPAAPAPDFSMPAFPTLIRPNLFSDCLLENSGWQNKQRRGSLLFSAVVQTLVVSVLIMIPLIYTDVLPAGQLVTYLMAPPPPPPPPPAPAVVKPVNLGSNMFNGQLITPTAIPTKIKMIREEETPSAATGGVEGGVVGGVPGGQLGGVMGGVLGGIVSSNRPPAVEAAPVKRLRISQGVSEGMLLTRAKPEYPVIAKMAHVEGAVILEAIISKDGTIENLHVVSGNPLLIKSAIEAVQQWRYKPYMLNGMAVDVETKITVDFQLTGQ